MRRLLLLFSMVLPLLFVSCSKSGIVDKPGLIDGGTFPGNLTMNVSNLDTITPPINPLHPLTEGADTLPAYYGYLDAARYYDGKRYCALIGMGGGHYVYHLVDSQWKPIRYNSPVLDGCHVGELLYIRGFLRIVFSSTNKYFLLQPVDIERTDSIISYYDVYELTRM